MGATGWTYFVPYQPDVGKALEELRWQVFRSGAYQTSPVPLHGWEEVQEMTDEEFEQFLASWQEKLEGDYINYDPEEAKRQQEFFRIVRALPDKVEDLTTPDQLVAWNHDGESGTHSIIDIGGINGWAAPVRMMDDEEELIQMFDTTQPEHDVVAERAHLVGSRRYEARCIVVYKDGKPHELCFTGFSGD